MHLVEEIQGIPCFIYLCLIFIKLVCCIVTVSKHGLTEDRIGKIMSHAAVIIVLPFK